MSVVFDALQLLNLAIEAEAAKVEPQNIRTQSLKPQNFLLHIF